MDEFEQITQAEQHALKKRVIESFKRDKIILNALNDKDLSSIKSALISEWNESVQFFKELNAHIQTPLDEISTARLISDSSSVVTESTLSRHISSYSILNTVPIVYADGDVEDLDMFKWKIGKIFFLKQMHSNIFYLCRCTNIPRDTKQNLVTDNKVSNIQIQWTIQFDCWHHIINENTINAIRANDFLSITKEANAIISEFDKLNELKDYSKCRYSSYSLRNCEVITELND